MPKVKPRQEAFGATVKRLRKERGLNQEALAERAGLSSRYVSRVELGNVNLGLDALFDIAAALEMHPGDLLKEMPPASLPTPK